MTDPTDPTNLPPAAPAAPVVPSVPPPVPPPPPAPPPPGYPAPPWGYQPPATYTTTRTEPFAIVSLVAALAGVFFCFVGAVVAIVFGHLARSRIKRSSENGSGIALAGLLIGWAEIGLGIVAVVVIVFAVHHSGGDATPSARRLAAQIRVDASRSGASPRDGDIVRSAIRELDLGEENVLVGSTFESAETATSEDLSVQHWRLEVHHGLFNQACVYLPATTDEPVDVVSGGCPGPDF